MSQNTPLTTAQHSKNTMQEHPFAQYIRIIGKGKTGSRSLTEQEAYDAFRMILNGDVLDVQIGAFLMLLRVKEEAIDELVGFTKAVKDDFVQSSRFDASCKLQIDLDWSSYAGKRKHYPWFLLSALTLAQHGYRVFMHGVASHTAQRLYTEDVLTALGYPICHTQQQVAHALEQSHFAYMPLQALSPRLHDFMQLRPILGLRSPIHTLVRLFNPFNAPATLQAIFHPAYRPTHQQSAQRLGYLNSAVIKGEGGEFERNPDAKTLVCSVKQSEFLDYELPKRTPNRSPAEDCFDLDLFKNVWLGKQSHEYGEMAIIDTLVIALRTMNVVHDTEQAQQLAEQLWHTRHHAGK
ncbi:MAG: glycosyl transferase family protein [Acinetobacter sp.]|nr:glycosyl transferase family protein [Acinetobacter sp.]